MENQLSSLVTEQRNSQSINIDQMSTFEILHLMNEEDRKLALSIREALPSIEKSIESVVKCLEAGGRLIYMGAGTSGRLGLLDAVECPPTFSTPPELVQGLMAGGDQAIKVAVEGAEDNEDLGMEDLKNLHLTSKDVIVGIAASGRTPYVIGGLKYAKSVGAKTVALACNKGSAIGQLAEHAIEVVVGPEILTGSTRLKAATAQKMVLNMISTISMVKIGKVYENLMIDVNASNKKLVERAKNILMTVTNVSYEKASFILDKARMQVKPSIVMIEANVSYEQAIDALKTTNGFVREAIQIAKGNK